MSTRSVRSWNNERVRRDYDDMASGLSRYIHDAIMVNGDRHQIPADTSDSPM